MLGGGRTHREIIGSEVLSTASKGHAQCWPPPDRSRTGFIGPLITIDEDGILRQDRESECQRARGRNTWERLKTISVTIPTNHIHCVLMELGSECSHTAETSQTSRAVSYRNKEECEGLAEQPQKYIHQWRWLHGWIPLGRRPESTRYQQPVSLRKSSA